MSILDKHALCPCGSTKSYDDCCHSFHEGIKTPSPLELVKARYAAYAMNRADFIMKTTHPASPQYETNYKKWEEEISNFSHAFSFEGAEIIDSKEQNTVAIVTFVAHLKEQDKEASFTERSFFEKRQGDWLYRCGQLFAGYAPNQVTLKEMRLLPLAYYGDPILRVSAEPITTITPQIKTLIAEMEETMDASQGIGLAAPQVHHSIRLFIIRTPLERADGGFESGETQVFINPVLSDPSQEIWTVSEGCLSIPTIHQEVTRPKEISISYMNEEGQPCTKRVKGWEARVIQHENDHLNGHFFIDHLSQEALKGISHDLLSLHERIHDPLAL